MMQKKIVDDRYYKLLRKIQEVDFVLVELNLYLDTHPHDMQAIQQFNQFAQLRKPLVQEFESCYGPLMNFGHSFSRYPFEWVESPWPWQV